MQYYIGTKLIQAKPMNLGDYNKYRGWTIPEDEGPAKEGYLVKYSDTYESWSPADVFERAYLKLTNTNRITEDEIDAFIKKTTSTNLGEKTTVVQIELVNGVIITEGVSFACTDKYDEEIGKLVGIKRIKRKVMELLGFLLQTARNGIK